jgi:hypothetical protein
MSTTDERRDDEMNTMHEMLLPDLIDLKIADRRAEAAAWRQAHETTGAGKPERGWSLSGVLHHLPSLGSGRPAPTKAL